MNIEEYHSTLKSIFLNLFPGILILIGFIILAPFFIANGFPPAFILILCIFFFLIPFQLGLLVYLGKKKITDFL